jgi:archaellum component FlaC
MHVRSVPALLRKEFDMNDDIAQQPLQAWNRETQTAEERVAELEARLERVVSAGDALIGERDILRAQRKQADALNDIAGTLNQIDKTLLMIVRELKTR